MNEKNTKKLLEDFPDLYKQHKLSPQKSSMCWLFECGDGWFDLIYDLSKHISLLEPTVEAVQVKEKFGGLRFYINHGSKEVYNLIDEAERKSLLICENCGTTDNVKRTTEGWITTLCDKCCERR